MIDNSIQKELLNALDILKKGGNILYPTDTIWGVGCDATDEKAVQEIYTLKKREESKSMIIFVSSIEMLKDYVPVIPEEVRRVLADIDKPTTVIYNNPQGLAINVVASDHTVGIRLVKEPFCVALINAFGKPIVSTSANISGITTPQCFDEIDNSILEGVDYVVNLHRDKKVTQPSSIIRFTDKGEIEYIRK